MLRWFGYFKEAVEESALENWRVRRVTLLFYLEDDTCQVTEPKEDNSGLPQVGWGLQQESSCNNTAPVMTAR